uniref:Uncharacterized protein n=1 Tax=Rhizophora mucronata TaxID=61149 RepID=A0A2P2MSN3_RHIMU
MFSQRETQRERERGKTRLRSSREKQYSETANRRAEDTDISLVL